MQRKTRKQKFHVAVRRMADQFFVDGAWVICHKTSSRALDRSNDKNVVLRRLLEATSV